MSPSATHGSNGQVNGGLVDGEAHKTAASGDGTNGVTPSNDTNGYVTNGAAALNGTNGHGTNGTSSTNGANGIHDHQDDLIAICGMACRLPDGLHTPAQLWDFLVAKGDARTKVPASRYNVDAYYDPTGAPGTVKSEHGYFLDVDLTKVDGGFSPFVRSALEKQDPHQRQLSEVVRECLEDAGETKWQGALIGCYVGCFGEDWVESFAKDNQQHGLYRVGGYGDFMQSNAISYQMDLRGPSMTIRTGCSASLVGLHEACQAIHHGDCTAAIVAGANLILGPGMTLAMTEQGVLSQDGSCKTFSADADGYGRGEAVSAVYIKPLKAALRDGNPVRAVIRRTATNVDGRTNGISMPCTETQEAMIRHAYRQAGITDFSKTGFVECHGTGTPIGDPIEALAVANVFGGSEHGVYIGSVKPNLGHSEGASGLTSLIKMIMALENQTIPPQIKFSPDNPNPNIPFESRNLKVPLDPLPWPEHSYERASINSFGIGGSNAHVILESARFHGVDAAHARASSPNGFTPSLQEKQQHEHEYLMLSANSSESLRKLAEAYQGFVQANPEKLPRLAQTLAHGREHLPYRTFVIATGDGEWEIAPTVRAPSKRPSLIMVFTGQGAQWAAMGAELLRQKGSVFQSTIRALDSCVRAMSTSSEDTWSLERELLQIGKKSRMHLAEVSQPLCTAVQIALVDSLAAAGIKPAGVVGHSSGEIAAAYAAGALTAQEAIAVAWYRGAVAGSQQRAGAMAAVGLGWEGVKPYLEGTAVTVACENSPSSVTISGDVEQVELVVAKIKKYPPGGQEVLARLLKVDKAYHSYHMAEVGEKYQSLLEEKGVKGSAPVACPFYSSVTGTLLQEDQSLGAWYWRANIERPVLFSTAVSEMLVSTQLGKAANPVLFLEVGPHSAMAGPLRQIMGASKVSAPYVSTLTRNQPDIASYKAAIGKLHQHNVPVDLGLLAPKMAGVPFLADLPRYEWDHAESYWYETRVSKEWRLRKHRRHELLGHRVAESTDLEPAWRNVFHLEHSSWISDHIIGEDVVFPFAGYMSMAAEAVLQTTGIDEGYALRHVIVSTAMVVTQDRPVELVTTLRPLRLTDALDSQWYEFSISSHNGVMWSRHCVGQVKALEADSALKLTKDPRPLPRSVSKTKAYGSMSQAGLCYGKLFQGLQDIRAGTTVNTASATVEAPAIDGAKKSLMQRYHIHPIILDQCLQILSVAATRGFTKRLSMVIPTTVQEIHVYRTSEAVEIEADAVVDGLGGVNGKSRCFVEGRPVLEMTGARLTPVPGEQGSDSTKDTHPTARYEWTPHVDFLDAKDFLHTLGYEERGSHMGVLDELTRLAIIYCNRRLKDWDVELPYLRSYRDWLAAQVNSQFKGQADVGTHLLDECTLYQRTVDTLHRLDGTPVAGAALAIFKILNSITSIFKGELTALGVLLADNSLAKVEELRDRVYDIRPYISQLAQSNPNLRILELGAGKSSNAQEIVEALSPQDGIPMYSEYSFTDPSAGMVTAAKEKFKHLANVNCTALDISRPLGEQNFDDMGQFDVIIAVNVLHATTDLRACLDNVGTLLKPRGRFLLQEYSSNSKWLNFILGVLPWWWSAASDGRAQEPYVEPGQWNRLLEESGLSVSTELREDTLMASSLQNNLWIASHKSAPIASIVDGASNGTTNGITNGHFEAPVTTVLCLQESDKPSLELVTKALTSSGVRTRLQLLGEDVSAGANVIAFLDQNSSFFDSLDTTRFGAFRELVDRINANDGSILWVTRPCQTRCDDPSFAQVLGAARTLRSETSASFATLEVDDDLEVSAALIADVYRHFQAARSAGGEGESDPDYEYAIHDGVVHVGRFHPFSLNAVLQTADTKDCVVLETKKPGLLSQLNWSRRPASLLTGNLVQVDVHAAGLNFRDVLSANGIVEIPEEGFGLEASGIVTAVGPEVQHVQPGDRVFLFSRGCFSTSVLVPEELCEPLPDNLSFEDAASMPCVYATAIYSLFNIGRLQKGQTVLIHSACGGVGIAAIQLAQMAGAEIYATVSSEKKVAYLVETFGLPRNRIFQSRDASFLQGVLTETQGHGVDLVLNSLSGELLHATWQCVAEFGSMIEIGKRDLLGSAKLDMSPFLKNRSYCCVDLDQICFKRRATCKELLKSVLNCYRDGHIKPIRPIQVFSAADIREAFRNMQQGLHMGKIVINLRVPSGDLTIDTSITKRKRDIHFEPDASYLLVGGMGGLGRAVSRSLAESGARHLVFLSRSAAVTKETEPFIRDMESMGVKVTLIQGSVTEMEDVIRAVGAAPNLKGIFQMTMVLRDQSWDKMTLDEWEQATAPKVQGSWNLHRATLDQSLDFFLLFSSISGIIGQPGQANYAAANSFLDAFAMFRASQGLPAAAIDIGAVDDIGVISNNESLRRAMQLTGAYMIKEVELLEAVEAAVLLSAPKSTAAAEKAFGATDRVRSHNNFVLGLASTTPLNSPNNRSLWKRDMRMAAYRNIETGSTAVGGGGSDTLKAWVVNSRHDEAVLKDPETAGFLARQIGKKLFQLVLRPEEELQTSMALADLGMDSLVAIEMRSWWKATFGFPISMLEMLGMGNLDALGEHAVEGLLKALQGSS